MNTPLPVAQPSRRRIWRWVFLSVAMACTPLLVLGVAAWSFLTLDRDAAVLRREVMAASHSDWHTKVQASVGGLTLGATRQVLRFIEHEHMDEAREALAAVRSASVGVYERTVRDATVASRELMAHTDATMRGRGWTRLVGVVDGKDTVMIYSSDRGSGDRIDLCLAVVDEDNLVVVSTAVDADAMDRLVARYAPEDLKAKLKLARG